MRYALLLPALIGLSAAACSAPGTLDSEPAVESAPALPREGLAMSEFSISMRRGACFGRCPQYTVTIDGAGGVTFDGDRFVNVAGTQSGKADMAAVSVLRSKTNEVFSTLSDVVSGAASCKNYATDHPQISLEWRTADGVRTLRHYTGCTAVPAKLIELEALIDRTANVDEWVSGPALK